MTYKEKLVEFINGITDEEAKHLLSVLDELQEV